MTDLLRKAFEEASKLPEAEQDALANMLLDELRSERSWQSAFGPSEHVGLSKLAEEARHEYGADETRKLEDDEL